ncbi:MAG: prepilin peptidase [Alphaproteobacteria bacterium]
MPESLAADPFIVLFVLLFLGIMAAAAIYDLVTYTIPHFAPVLLTGMFIIFAVWQGLSWPVLIDHTGVGIAMLIAGWALFAFGLMGGGDVKLFAATSLWMGWGGIVNYLIMFSICGGVLALVLLLFRRLPLPVRLSGHGWVAVLHNKEQGVPYGIALTIGALLAWPDILTLPSL